MLDRRAFMQLTGAGSVALALGQFTESPATAAAPAAPPRTLITPIALSRFTETLPIPPTVDLRRGGRHTLVMRNGVNRFHAALGDTPTFGYNAPYLGPVVQVARGVPVSLKFVNALTSHPVATAVDSDVPGAMASDATAPRVSVHVHGGKNKPHFDGHPQDWFRPGQFKTYRYQNDQEAATVWYHDHAEGITRLNVYGGLASGYLIRDRWDTGTRSNGPGLPSGRFEIPLVIQDKSFNADGTLAYPPREDPPAPPAPQIWVPEFFGDVAVVNGRAWPNLDVAQGLYRFRVFNGAQSRFWNLALSDGTAIFQIGTDGGLLDRPVPITQETPLLLGPGERADILVDFRGKAGRRIVLTNNAPTPFPNDDPAAPDITEVMQFTVTRERGFAGKVPHRLRRTPIKRLRPADVDVVRNVTLIEMLDDQGRPVRVLLNNLPFHAPDSQIEKPRRGTVEQWNIINLTGDTHPIHLHLVQFQVLARQHFDAAAYADQFLAPFGTKVNATAEPFVDGPPTPPAENERGPKDTVRANPDEITRILVPFTDIRFSTDNPFRSVDRTRLIRGYVWHCHILEHEDNEMMQRYRVLNGRHDDNCHDDREDSAASQGLS